IIRSLIYIILGIRLNIVYIIPIFARYITNPIKVYFYILKKVFIYSKSIRD
ncbi:hypothetical protein B0H65DRAFT_432569, partial [Neurospora tetraspora]